MNLTHDHSAKMTSRLVVALVGALCLASAAKTVAEEPLLALTDANLLEAIAEHKLMLLSIGIEGCVPCEVQEQMHRHARQVHDHQSRLPCHRHHRRRCAYHP